MLQSEPPPPPTGPQPSRRRRHRRRPRSGDVADHDHRDPHDDHQRGANDQLDPIALLERVKHLPTKDLATVPPTRAQGVWTTLAVWIPLPGPIRSWFSLTPVGAAVAPDSLPAADDDSIRRKKSSTGKRKSKAKPRRDAESEFALRLQSQVAEFERLQAEQEASVKANILLPATAPAADPATSLGGPCDSSASPDPSTRPGDAPTTTTIVSDDEDDPYNLRDLLKATNSAPAESTQPTSPARSSTPPPAVIAARPSLAAALDLGPTPGLILLRSNLHLPPSPTRRTLDPPLLPHAEEPRGRTRARAPRRASAASDSFQQQPDKSHRDPSVHSSVSQVASSSAAHQSLAPEAVAEIAAMRTQLAELKAAFAALQAQYMQAAVTSTSPPPPPPPPPMLMMGGPPPPPPPPPPPMLMPTPPLILPTSSSRSKPVAAAQPAAALNMAQLLNEMKSVQLRPRRTDAGEPRPRTPERAAPAAVSAKSPQDALREALIRRFAQTRRAREASHEDEQSVHGVDDEWSATTGNGAQGEADDEDARKVAAARLGLKRAKEQAPPTVVEVAANIVPLAVLRRGESSSNLELDQAGNLRSKKGGELAPGKDGTFDPRQFLTKRGGGARKRSPGPVVKQDSAVEEQSDKEQRVVSGGGDGQDKKEVETV